MEKFVDRIANHIKVKDYVLTDLTIVLPSRRAKKYIQKALFEQYDRAVFSPNILTIDEWVKNYTPQSIIDRTWALFKLYEIHEKISGSENKGLDEFLKWGRTLLSDFDEIDRYLIETKQLFVNLLDVKELEAWNVGEDELTDAQKRFLAFWETLPDYYKAFKDMLKHEDAINMGAAYASFSQNLHLLFEENQNAQFIFAGFNALSKAEESIMLQLKKMGKAEIFIDVDEFYMKDHNHEAGMFLRPLAKSFELKKEAYMKSHYASSQKKIELVNCKQSTGQAKTIATLLKNEIQPKDFSDTVVLLADENMVVPILKNIPSTIKEANITLGLPLKNTSLRAWVDMIFNIQENFRRFSTKSIYYKDLLKLNKHPFMLAVLSDADKLQLQTLEDKIVHNNWLFLQLDQIKISKKVKELIAFITQPWNLQDEKYTLEALGVVRKLNDLLYAYIDKEEHTLEKAIIYNFDASLVALQNILESFAPKINFNSFKQIFNEHWSTQSLAYFGNPLDGLQIMGLLETRLLDFKNLLVVGLNEGSMPPNNPIQTLIPMDLRRYHGLPTPREKQGLFAHHVYRLLHHAENVWITYSSAERRMGVDEASRYVHQVKLELSRQFPNISLVERDYSIEDTQQSSETISVEKSPAILARLDEYFGNRTSASALNKYLQCPLDFYYRYVLGFGEEKEVEEEIEANNFGSFIHNTLETLLKPFSRVGDGKRKGQNVLPEDIDQMLKTYGPILQKEFIAHFDKHKEYLETGKNFLSLTVADHLVKSILKAQKEELISNPTAQLFIEEVEGEFTKELNIQLEKSEKLVKFVGFIDRIDNFEDEVRIIDYKSGTCNTDKVKIPSTRGGNSPQDVLLNVLSKKHYVFQLLVYNMLYKARYPQKPYPGKTGILSMVNLKDGIFFLDNKLKEAASMDDLMELFEECLQQIIAEIYDETIPFEHNPDAQYCQYCG